MFLIDGQMARPCGTKLGTRIYLYPGSVLSSQGRSAKTAIAVNRVANAVGVRIALLQPPAT